MRRCCRGGTDASGKENPGDLSVATTARRVFHPANPRLSDRVSVRSHLAVEKVDK